VLQTLSTRLARMSLLDLIERRVEKRIVEQSEIHFPYICMFVYTVGWHTAEAVLSLQDRDWLRACSLFLGSTGISNFRGYSNETSTRESKNEDSRLYAT
jgi:hypothetical protein